MDKLRFLSIGSGSSGNCYYFGNSSQGILIDAGIAARTVRKSLKEIGVDLSQIMGIFISHDHYDHIKAVGTFGEKFHIPVFATEKVHEAIDNCWSLTGRLDGCKRYIEPGKDVEVGDFTIKAFPVSHDATDNNGFFFTYGTHKITIATDIGCSNDLVCSMIKKSDVVILEANYDTGMLENGHYPYYLKKRIASDTGHMDNIVAGHILSDNWHSNLKHIYLCHLSKDNNTPEIAERTVCECFEESGINCGVDVDIRPLNRGLDDLVMFDNL